MTPSRSPRPSWMSWLWRKPEPFPCPKCGHDLHQPSSRQCCAVWRGELRIPAAGAP